MHIKKGLDCYQSRGREDNEEAGQFDEVEVEELYRIAVQLPGHDHIKELQILDATLAPASLLSSPAISNTPSTPFTQIFIRWDTYRQTSMRVSAFMCSPI